MCEVGFRDQSATMVPKDKPEATADDTETQDDSKLPEDSRITRAAPALAPRPALRGSNPENQENSSSESRLQSRGPPPPVPRNSVIKPQVDRTLNTREDPSDSEVVNVAGHDKQGPALPPRPSVPLPGAVPALPARPPTSSRPSAGPQSAEIGAGTQSQPSLSSLKHSSGSDGNQDSDKKIGSENAVDNAGDPSDLYSVINKPKRPTIIRPTKPSVKNVSESKMLPSGGETSSEHPESKEENSLLGRNQSSTISNKGKYEMERNSGTERDENVPEFLRKKLKSTVNTEPSTAGSSSVSPSSQCPAPPLKPKPSPPQKPALAAKPIVAVKPAVALKPSVISPQRSVSDSSVAIVTSVQNSHSSTSDTKDLNNEQSKGSPPSKVESAKRPTIIRPAKPQHSGSVENIKDLSAESSHAAGAEVVDNVTNRLLPPRPLPSKRPVSMISIPKHVEQDVSEQSLDSLSHKESVMTKSTENIRESESPRPSPRPVARTRPTSVVFPAATRPQLPKHGMTTEDLNTNTHSAQAPPRPQGRPSQSSTQEVNKGDGLEDDKKSHRTSIHKLGVSVLPPPKGAQPLKLEPEMPEAPKCEPQVSPPPPKPAHRPPPPRPGKQPDVHGEEDSTDSSSDEEFVTAKDKPDRPPGNLYKICKIPII